MNIPLDRLYHYIESVAKKIYGDHVIIYRFWPHGSKNIHDLNPLRDFNLQEFGDWCIRSIHPAIWCHDQEPLDHTFYKENLRITISPVSRIPKNLNYRRNIYAKSLLLHSEQRSIELEKHRQDGELIPVYYWSHAVIARDWFRYAEHENFVKSTKKIFLIYNRAWSNTREYRLKFSDLLIETKLVPYCQTSCNAIEPELNLHYTDYDFKNPTWRPRHILENFLKPTPACSTSSADFSSDDYNSTDIEVVLETLFDDTRLHLTEKILRPIACGQPFILASTHGSLEFLRRYGFQTFAAAWDESYDCIQDPEKRLRAIVQTMNDIAKLDPEVYKSHIKLARKIAELNRQWFFSQEFFDTIVQELKNNFQFAFKEFNQCDNYTDWINRWEQLLSDREAVDYLAVHDHDTRRPNKSRAEFVLDIARKKHLLKRSVPS